jgi:hypothetical protein
MIKKLFLGIFWLTAQVLYSQSQIDLFEEVENLTVLNSQHLDDYLRIAQFGEYSEVQLVEIHPLSYSLNSSDNLEISPFDANSEECQNIEFKPKSSRYLDDQNYYYYGLLLKDDTNECSCRYGEIMLQAENGLKFGFLTINDSFYEIIALNTTYSILAKVNKSITQNVLDCGQVGSINPNFAPKSNIKIANRSNEPCTIKILFLYTNAAALKFTHHGLNQKTTSGIAQTNQAFSNSYISNVRVEKVAVLPFPGFMENSTSIVPDMVSIVVNPVIASLRDAYSADVVCVVTDGNYPDFAGYSGVMPASTGGGFIDNLGAPMQNLAFMIVEGYSFNANFTFSHELGHIIGCRHQTNAVYFDNASDDDGTIEHGYNWVEGQFLCKDFHCSIMHTQNSNYDRVLNYSNPNVLRSGSPTGTTNSENNASWINNLNGCIVANYYEDPTPIPLGARIEGEEFLCKPNIGNYLVLPSVQGSYTFEWHKSTNGVNWGQIIGNNQSININSGSFQVGQTVFLRVRVIDQQNNQVFAFFEITIGDPSDALCPREGNRFEEKSLSVNISPNPVLSDLNVQFTVVESKVEVLIQIYSITGVKLLEFNRQVLHGDYNEKISTANISPGLFLVKVKVGSSIYNQLVNKL